MSEKQAVIEQIRVAFQNVEFPGEGYLQGSFEGEEPYEEIAPFRARKDWANVEADFLDSHSSALSFFSEAGFRFFKREHDPDGLFKPEVDAALESFWLERARTAPRAEDLRGHLIEERERLEAIEADARARRGK